MKKMGLTFIYLWLISLCSCQKELIEYEKGDVKVCIEQGEQWLHDFPLFLGINKKIHHRLLSGWKIHKGNISQQFM